MTRQTLKRLMIKGTVAYVAVFSLVLMVAMPAIALMAANSVDSAAIIDHTIRSRDIRNQAVTTDRIAPRAVRRGKIARNAVNGSHIKSGAVKNSDIASVSDSKINYSTKTRYLTIVGNTFRPEKSDDEFASNNVTGSLYAEGTASVVYFFADVHLPDGATVTNIRLNIKDNTATPNAEVQLRRVNYSNVHNTLAVATSSDTSTSWRNFDDNNGLISKPVIDNQNYGYFARVRLNGSAGSNMTLGLIRITYTVAGP